MHIMHFLIFIKVITIVSLMWKILTKHMQGGKDASRVERYSNVAATNGGGTGASWSSLSWRFMLTISIPVCGVPMLSHSPGITCYARGL